MVCLVKRAEEKEKGGNFTVERDPKELIKVVGCVSEREYDSTRRECLPIMVLVPKVGRRLGTRGRTLRCIW